MDNSTIAMSSRKTRVAIEADMRPLEDGGVPGGAFVMPNVRAKRAPAVGRQAWAGENVERTARPGLVASRWRSA